MQLSSFPSGIHRDHQVSTFFSLKIINWNLINSKAAEISHLLNNSVRGAKLFLKLFLKGLKKDIKLHVHRWGYFTLVESSPLSHSADIFILLLQLLLGWVKLWITSFWHESFTKVKSDYRSKAKLFLCLSISVLAVDPSSAPKDRFNNLLV